MRQEDGEVTDDTLSQNFDDVLHHMRGLQEQMANAARQMDEMTGNPATSLSSAQAASSASGGRPTSSHTARQPASRQQSARDANARASELAAEGAASDDSGGADSRSPDSRSPGQKRRKPDSPMSRQAQHQQVSLEALAKA